MKHDFPLQFSVIFQFHVTFSWMWMPSPNPAISVDSLRHQGCRNSIKATSPPLQRWNLLRTDHLKWHLYGAHEKQHGVGILIWMYSNSVHLFKVLSMQRPTLEVCMVYNIIYIIYINYLYGWNDEKHNINWLHTNYHMLLTKKSIDIDPQS